MEEGIGEPWIDRHITQAQKDLVEKLSRYSNAAAMSYKGALYAYHRKDNPDRSSHFAYSLMCMRPWPAYPILHVHGRYTRQ